MAGWDWTFWSTAWSWDPGSILGIFLLVCVYFLTSGYLRAKSTPFVRAENTKRFNYLLGTAILFIALFSPLNAASQSYLFSAHMIQHVLISMVSAPLLISGIPVRFWDQLADYPVAHKVIRFISQPVLTFFVYFLTLSFWHIPAIHNTMMANPLFGSLQLLSFFIAGLLFWFPVMVTSAKISAMPDPLKMVYLFLAVIPCTVLGVIIIFAPEISYHTYAMAARITPLDALTDQQVAGIIMAVPSMFILLGALLVIFYKWYQRENK